MGRSVRAAAIAAAMLISLPAAAFADTGAAAHPGAVAAVDCPAPGAGAAPAGSDPAGTAPDAGSAPDAGTAVGGGSAPGAGSAVGGAGVGSGPDAGGGDGTAGTGKPGGTGTSAAGAAGSEIAPEAPGEETGSGGSGDSGPGPDAGSGPGDGSDFGSGPGNAAPGPGDDPAPGDGPGSGGATGPGAVPGPGDDPGPGYDAAGSGGAQVSPGGTTDRATTDPADCDPAATPPDDPAAPATPSDLAGPSDPAGPSDLAAPGAYAGADTSAATAHGWGEPDHVDEFDTELSGWNLYDGPGHAGEGTRSPAAASVENGILTIDGDADGTTAGMAWTGNSQKYGRWEGRVRAPESDPTYNALLLLWPTAEDFPVGGEIDFMEMTDHTRQTTELFLHYGEDNSQVQGEVEIDGTQWNNWAVEWTPDSVVAYVNGEEWWRTEDTSILPPGPMHLCIQLDWFPDGDGGVAPSKMEVDWVRQYSLPESETTGAAEGLVQTLGERITEGIRDPVQGAATRAPSGH
ncbi:family 16 glycosylhydrolase [Pseudonocardia sp. NPDC046786]|uniref:family 16 glycosylhydrolase n=1 Tax=Pseudonocardia sp. NPDC046786 TaxID=3155471 RepID=UPI003404086D